METNKKLNYVIFLFIALLLGCCLYVFLTNTKEEIKNRTSPINEKIIQNKNLQKEEQIYVFNKEKFKIAEKGLLKMENHPNLGEKTKNLIQVFKSNLPDEDKAAFWYLSYGYNFVKLINKLNNNQIKPYCDGLFKAVKNSEIYVINPTGKHFVNQIIKIQKPKIFFEKVLKDLKNSNVNKSNPYITAIEKCLAIY
jgi:flagellar motor component MotA